ncbi:MAG TPA: 3-hydroxyacyl-CoA dehydrogenase family protein [Candidatus Binatia bacterium]|jgi:3-hydroxybutyryl-CoA dehydrogenase|nr:3-hydroxyacyl-CoA dehydrogenase family protein [Candidatus Binatia bacterium]
MAKNSVLVVGKNRIAREIAELCKAGGFEPTIHPDVHAVVGASGASPSLIVETSARGDQKREILSRLDAQSPSAVILTSCLGYSTTRIASWIVKPERLVGFATFYPLEQKKVIELSGGLKTQEGPLREAETFFGALGKEPVRVKDIPGLIFPRILSLIINEASRSLDEGVAEAEEIDVAMRLGVNYPSGPLRWADQIGLDEVLAVLEGLHEETGDDRYRPAPLLRKMVLAGWLGESSGRGFYRYNESRVER